MAEQSIDVVVRARDLTREAFKQIEGALGELDRKVDGVDKSSKKMSMSFGDIAKGTAAVAGVVTGAAAGIALLGSRGAEIDDLKGAFDQMNKAIGNDSTEVLSKLKTSFAGTISDFDILKMSNTALTTGLKLSAGDFELLADSARVLADRTGKTVPEAFETLSKAMATGKTKGAELLIGTIDNVKAEEDFARALGKEAKDLNEAGKAAAAAAAIKRELQKELQESGKASVDFGDKVDQSKVKITNMVDSIGSWIAQNPGIGTFSSAVTGAAGTVTALGMAWGPMSGGFKALVPLLGSASLATGGFSIAMKGLALSMGPVAIAIAAVTAALAIGYQAYQLWSESAGRAASAKAQETTDTANLARINKTLGTSYTDMNEAVKAAGVHAAALREKNVGVTAATSDKANAVVGAKKAIDEETASLFSNKTAADAAAKGAKELTDWKEKQATAYRALANEMGELEIKQVEKADEINKALIEKDRIALDQMRAHGQEMAAQELADRDANALLYLERERASYDEQLALDKAYHAMKSEAANAAGLAQMNRDLAAMKGFKDKLGGVFTGLPDVMMAAFTGGGDVGKSIGGSIFGKLFDEKGPLSGVFKKGGDFLGKLAGGGIGKMMGSSLGSMMGPLGTMLGGMAGELIGPLIGKVGGFFKDLFGGPNGIEVEGRKTAASFRDQIASTLTEAQKAEAGTDEWKKSVIGVRDAYIAAGKTEQEALEIMDRLWKAEKKGGDAVKVVIAEINTNMGALGNTSARAAAITERGFDAAASAIADTDRQVKELESTLGDTAAAANSAAAAIAGAASAGGGNNHTDKFRGGGTDSEGRSYDQWLRDYMDDNPSATTNQAAEHWAQNLGDASGSMLRGWGFDTRGWEGFAHGTGGQFLDFGAGTPTILHGRERVVTEAEGMSEAARFARLEALLSQMASTVMTMPALLSAAQRDALLMAGSRR